MKPKEIGMVGLGKMGGGMAALALEKGYKVVGSTKGSYPDELDSLGLVAVDELGALKDALSTPRVVLLSLPAGETVDMIADELVDLLEPGDIIVDSGNSYWGDSQRRHHKYAQKHIHFLDLGTSGGLDGARIAPCFMIGGPESAVKTVEPFLLDLATPGGYVHAGGSGAGHFVKLVHNGIEFGMLQAIGEGMALLDAHPEDMDIQGTLECWRHGSVIRSWLIDLMAQAHREDPNYAKPEHWIEDTGEVNWLITDALDLDVATPIITQSVINLVKSRDESGVAEKAITQMRHKFGGHPYGRDKEIAAERHRGRVGGFRQFDLKE